MKYSKTEAGQSAFKERSILLSARQRSAFILFDGKRTVAQVLEAAAGLGITQADIDHMMAQSFLAAVELPVPVAAAQPPVAAPEPSLVASLGERSSQDRYKEAKPLATKLTAGLGLRGFMLNLSVESAAGYEDLLALLPKIQAAVRTKACRELEAALNG